MVTYNQNYTDNVRILPEEIMIIDRVKIKHNAQMIIRQSKPSLLTAGLIMTALSALIGFLSLRLTGIDIKTATDIMNASAEGRAELAASLMMRAMPSRGEIVMDLLLRLALAIVGAGFSLFVMNSVRKTEPVLGNLLDGFSMMPRMLLLLLLESFFIAFWSMFFIIPGIVAAYRYRFAVYIMIDHPELGAMDCIRESKRLSYGYKGQLFVLDISFILWFFLCTLPVIGYAVQVYLKPYMETSRVLYYELICRSAEYDEVTLQ